MDALEQQRNDNKKNKRNDNNVEYRIDSIPWG